MKPCENLVSLLSDCYMYTPSATARDIFLYPIYTGNFIYEAGYQLYRESYDSILLMYIRRGSMTLLLDGRSIPVSPGSFVLVDCYQPHAYGSVEEYECLWLHFDGITARKWYHSIVGHHGNVIAPADPYPAFRKLEDIFLTFHTGKPVNEALISQSIHDILTLFLLDPRAENAAPSRVTASETAIAYIRDHFSDEISVEQLAGLVNISPYHFIRVFKRETGLTPHKYLFNTRLNAAKYLLIHSSLSLKEICLRTGFSCESVFCTAFKKHLGMTPMQYRDMTSASNP